MNRKVEAELSALSQAQLQVELDGVLADMEDLRELRRGFLGQTGVHIGMRVLRQVTSQLDSEEARLKKQRERLDGLLAGISS